MTGSLPHWDWLYGRYEGCCLTLTQGVTPETLLQRYGADTSAARQLAFPQAYSVLQPGPDTSVLRAGSLPGWAFCLETLGVQGAMPAVLAALSRDAQTISVTLDYNALHVLHHWVGGRPRESFVPGQVSSLRAAGPHPFWDMTERHRSRQPDHPAVISALEAVGDVIGGHLPPDIAEKPLLTTLLSWTLPPLPSPVPPLPPVHPFEPRPVGPPLVGLQVPEDSPQPPVLGNPANPEGSPSGQGRWEGE
ncbi:DUF6461 domain-containing protein [Streptomyces sp. NPDC059629]|uniref:DUF6461 domain-containing protein n=1 Tax=Streptomyces sp. NPDC059629 TaxID=3346889 RepID=UPI003673DB26